MKAMIPVKMSAANRLPMTAPAMLPVFEDLEFPLVEDAVGELVDVAVDPVGVVLATTAAPEANPSYGNANA